MKVILMASVTADGFIAQATDQSSLEWTSKQDTQFFVEKSKEIGVLIMGSTTFETIGRPLSGRRIIVLSKSKSYPQFSPEQVAVSSLPPKELLESLEGEGVSAVMIAGGASVYTQFLSQKLVTELYLTVEPVLFGSGVKLLSDAVSVKLDLQEVIHLSDQTKAFHYHASYL